jgi:hypothetical protein
MRGSRPSLPVGSRIAVFDVRGKVVYRSSGFGHMGLGSRGLRAHTPRGPPGDVGHPRTHWLQLLLPRSLSAPRSPLGATIPLAGSGGRYR